MSESHVLKRHCVKGGLGRCGFSSHIVGDGILDVHRKDVKIAASVKPKRLNLFYLIALGFNDGFERII